MRIGIPKEIKDQEFRVGLTPAGAQALAKSGHQVFVQAQAGSAIGFFDEQYTACGATVVQSPEQIFDCDMVVKVKEPQPSEYGLFRDGLVLFGYLHLAVAPQLVQQLLQRKVVAIAYETVSDTQGELPLLIPMSQVAGRLAPQAGALALTMAQGGNGTLLAGVPGVLPAKVVILGGGTVGTNAARIAMGMGADVTLLDVNLPRLRTLEEIFGDRLKTCYSEMQAIEKLVPDADLVIGSVLLPGKHAPKLITRELVRKMHTGSAFVDVAIDQGGCSETSRPTTHSNPMYVDEGIVHYCVTNMPAATARTSTLALTQATLPYIRHIANQGYKQALRDNAGLRNGLNTLAGHLAYRNLAEDLGKTWVDPLTMLN